MISITIIELLKKLNRLSSLKQVLALQLKKYDREDDKVKISKLAKEHNQNPSENSFNQLISQFDALSVKYCEDRSYLKLKKLYLGADSYCEKLRAILNDKTLNQTLEETPNFLEYSIELDEDLLNSLDKFLTENKPHEADYCNYYKGVNGAYDTLMELVLSEKRFIDTCHSVEAEPLLELFEKDLNNEQCTTNQLKYLRTLESLKTLKNLFQLNFTEFFDYAQDISQFFSGIFNVMGGQEFSNFYKNDLVELVENYQGILKILTDLKAKYQKNQTYIGLNTNQQNALEGAFNSVAAPFQRLPRYVILLQAFVKNLNGILPGTDEYFSVEDVKENFSNDILNLKDALVKGMERRANEVNRKLGDAQLIKIDKLNKASQNNQDVESLLDELDNTIEQNRNLLATAKSRRSSLEMLLKKKEPLNEFENRLSSLSKTLEQSIYPDYLKAYQAAAMQSKDEYTFEIDPEPLKQIQATQLLIDTIYDPLVPIPEKKKIISDYKKEYGGATQLTARQMAVVALCAVSIGLVCAIAGALVGMVLSPVGSVAGAFVGGAIGVKAGLIIGGAAAGAAVVASSATSVATVCGFWASNSNARNPINKQMSGLADQAYKIVKGQRKGGPVVKEEKKDDGAPVLVLS